MKERAQTWIAETHTGTQIKGVRTTLYELIAAINEEVLPGQDWMVTDMVLELFETGQAKFLAATHGSGGT